MTKEDINTFNITFKTTNEAYLFITNWMGSYPEDINVISDTVLRDTDELYKQDEMFKKLVSNVKKASKIRDEYAMKHNYKYLDNGN